MDFGNILVVENIKYESIRSLFSKFESCDNAHQYIYDTLKLDNAFSLRFKDSYFHVSLYIQRIEHREDVPKTYSTITMTDLKPYWGWTYRTGKYEPIDLVKETANTLAKYEATFDLTNNIDCILPFDSFIAIDAQSQGDWKYQYGHTKTYAVVAAQYISET